MATIRRPLVFDRRKAKITATDSDLSREPYEYTYLNQREGIYGVREMTEVEYDNFKAWWRYLYMGDPSVYLTHVASGGSLGTLDDTRYDVGDVRTSTSTLYGAGSLDDPQLLTQASFSSIDQTIDLSVTAPTKLPPMLGWAGTSTAGKIEEMSEQQLYANTSYELGKLVTQTGSGMGGYLIHDDTAPVLHADSAETINLGLVYTDTYQALHTGIPPKSDTVITGTSYYLHECKAIGRPFTPWTFPRPVYRDGNDIREYAWQDLFDYHQDLMKYIAVYGRPDDNTGAIRYYLSTNGSGAGTTTLGTGMEDTRRADTDTVLTYSDGVDDYRSQEIPGGANNVFATYSLRGTRS